MGLNVLRHIHIITIILAIIQLANNFRSRNIPCDVIYLDIHYMESYKLFTWSKKNFPNPKQLIEELHNKGFKVVVIIDPGVKIEKNYKIYEEGIKNDFFIKYPDDTQFSGDVWPGTCNFPDFTKENVRTWWGKCFKEFIEDGIDGFWYELIK